MREFESSLQQFAELRQVAMITDDEPVEHLWTGEVALRAVVELVQVLVARGHRITVGLDSTVRVTPAVHEDTLHVLDSNWRDTEAALDALDVGPAIGSSGVWTIR